MRKSDLYTILGIIGALLVLGFIAFVVWFVSNHGASQQPTPGVSTSAATEPRTSESTTAYPTPTELEGSNDYSQVATEVPAEAREVTIAAVEQLAPWEQGQSVDDRRRAVGDLVPKELVKESPFEASLGGVERSKVTVDQVMPATLSGDHEPGADEIQVAQPVLYTLHIPNEDGASTTAQSETTWLFTLDMTGDKPKIVALTEPSGM